MKKILIFFITVILVIFIYSLYNKKSYTLYIGDDSNPIIEDNILDITSSNDYRLMDLINDINNNKIIIYNNKEYRLQNLLIKSNKIIISIGNNDIKYDYDYIDDMVCDLENLFKIIRKFSKEKIYLIEYKGTNEYIKYLNNKIKNNEYNIQIISLS